MQTFFKKFEFFEIKKNQKCIQQQTPTDRCSCNHDLAHLGDASKGCNK